MIGVLINSGAAWAAAARAAGVPEWKAAITGAPSIADRFAATAQAYLDAAEVEEGFADVVYANFGVYGEFAFVVVHLEDALVFMDPLNGNLFGPLEPGSALEAPPLLMEHPEAYEEGMGVRYFSVVGCPIEHAATWRPTPPPGSVPRALLPGAPAMGPRPPGWPLPPAPPPTLNPNRTRWWSDYTCTVVGTFCVCHAYGWDVAPGRLYWVRSTCRTPAGAGCPPPSAPANWNPTTPPATPGWPACLGTGPTIDWYY